MQEMTVGYDENLVCEELATEELVPETGEKSVGVELAIEVNERIFESDLTAEASEDMATLQARQDEILPVDELTNERRLKSWRYRDECGEERTFVLLQDGRRLKPRRSRATEERKKRHEGAKHDQWTVWDFVPITALVVKFRKTHLAAMPEFMVLQCPERITEAQRERLQLIFKQLKERWETKWHRQSLPLGGIIPSFERGWLEVLDEIMLQRNKILTQKPEQSAEDDRQLRGQMSLDDFRICSGGEI